ncbi:MAG: NlpC/P60 family protein [Anaerovoracaceae bacterium]
MNEHIHYREKFVLLIFLLIAILLFPQGVFAADAEIIVDIPPLPANISSQTIKVCDKKKPSLPETLTVYVEGSDVPIDWDSTSEGLIVKNKVIPVTWKSTPTFNPNNVGTYTYTPTLDGEYTKKDGVEFPEIKVKVIKRQTTVTGLSKSYTGKSRTSLKKKIKVTPAFERKLNIQQYTNGKWITKKSYTLENQLTDILNITFPTDWWKTTASTWRITLSSTKQGTSYTGKSIKINTKRTYQNPSKYIQIKNTINLKHSGAYNLNTGYMGIKVRLVNRYFHIGNRYWPRYTKQTKLQVKAFQKKKHLNATGIVNKETWLKMGYSKKSWITAGAYISPIQVNPSSTKKDHIEAMIRTAYKYLGSDYVVGGSGPPKQGADCSGLVMQGLYAAGVDPYPVSCVRHSKPGYEFESKNLWASKKLKTVSYAKKQRGDLIFYKGKDGTVNHIAIYLGRGKVVESWPNKVVIWPVKNSHRSRIMGVKRVFN